MAAAAAVGAGSQGRAVVAEGGVRVRAAETEASSLEAGVVAEVVGSWAEAVGWL